VIQGLTTGSAATTQFTDVGRLTEGCDADMVIYNQDLFTVSLESITNKSPKVLATYIHGKKMYDAGDPPLKIF
jgi:predicted amidohydrolase YtcJ